jgi:hypothetical protein
VKDMMDDELISTASPKNIVTTTKNNPIWSRAKSRIWLTLQALICIFTWFMCLGALFLVAANNRRLMSNNFIEYVDRQPNGVIYVYVSLYGNDTSSCVEYGHYIARSDRTNYNYYWLKHYVTHIFLLMGQMTALVVSSTSFYLEYKRFRRCEPPNELRSVIDQGSQFSKVASICSDIGHILFFVFGIYNSLFLYE